METLDVEPPVLFEVEDPVEFSVDSVVPMGPHPCFIKLKQRVHASTEHISMVVLKVTLKGGNSVLHRFFENTG